MSSVTPDKLFICHPGVGSRTYHIFDPVNSNRSLCGHYALLGIDSRHFGMIGEKTKWVKGQDCKSCFRKAGMEV